jgi:hypothetical protein
MFNYRRVALSGIASLIFLFHFVLQAYFHTFEGEIALDVRKTRNKKARGQKARL